MEILFCELKPGVDFGKIAGEWGKSQSIERMRELFPDANLDAVSVPISNTPCREQSVEELAEEWRVFAS